MIECMACKLVWFISYAGYHIIVILLFVVVNISLILEESEREREKL
jgi:hypothetical protein